MNDNIINTIICGDCLPIMRDMPDDSVDLVLTDPPYGIGEDGGRFRGRKGDGIRVLPKGNWDNEPPPKEVFDEIQRVSKNQVIWGGNYFTDKLPVSRGWLYWDKLMGGDFSDGELAWTSFDTVLKKFTLCNKMGGRVHPAQKPVCLGEWILERFTKPGDSILDTHSGSGSFCVAAKRLGRNYIGIDIIEEYCQIARDRLAAEEAGLTVKEMKKGQKGLFER
ncbi:MAG TPA: hypothetical protein ENH94_04865 [Phycisphaerales bacterium]|nr:hypothetical protein [Phycisphaerales bacterium]